MGYSLVPVDKYVDRPRRQSERSYYEEIEREGTGPVTSNYGKGTQIAPITPTTPVNPLPQQSVISQPDPMEEYRRMQDELKAAQRQSRIKGLDKARANALSALDTEQANVAPTYYNKRNQAAAASDVGAMNFANYMAARGIKGAAGAMPEIYRQAGLQSQIGALDQAEAQTMADIERQRAGINSAYEFDVAQANADVESQAMQNMIDAFWKEQQRRDAANQAIGLNAFGQPTIQKQQMETEATGYYNPWANIVVPDDVKEQLAPYMDNLQAFIDQQVPNSDMWKYAQALRYQKIMNDPTLREKYGQQYKTAEAMRDDLQSQLTRLQIEAQTLLNQNLPEKERLALEKARYEVATGMKEPQKLQAEIDRIKRETANIGANLAYNRSQDQAKTAANIETQTLISNALKAGSADEAFAYLQSVAGTAAANGANIVDVIRAINARWPKEGSYPWQSPTSP